jgi:hypothetical protein
LVQVRTGGDRGHVLIDWFRYGQEEIEAMLVAAGAKEHVEPPKKISVVGQ